MLYSVAIVSALSYLYSALAFVPAPRFSSLLLHLLRSSADTALDGFRFTGIAEEMGTIVDMEERGDTTLSDGSTGGGGTKLTVRSGGGVVMEGLHPGCTFSVCMSGVCLEATALDPAHNLFTVGLETQTFDKTSFLSLQRGQAVNLERASEIGVRNPGRFVQGRVDGTGTIVDKRVDGCSLRITVRVDEEHVDSILRYVGPNSFIAVEGTSLTVVHVDPVEQTFGFVLVEYMQKKTTISQKFIGEKVNLEVDALDKYSESGMASLLRRLEAFEAKVESLERRLLQVGGNRDIKNNKVTAVTATKRATNKSSAMHGRMTEEVTPTFGNYIQEGTPGYTNPSLSIGRKMNGSDDDGNIKFVTIQGSF